MPLHLVWAFHQTFTPGVFPDVHLSWTAPTYATEWPYSGVRYVKQQHTSLIYPNVKKIKSVCAGSFPGAFNEHNEKMRCEHSLTWISFCWHFILITTCHLECWYMGTIQFISADIKSKEFKGPSFATFLYCSIASKMKQIKMRKYLFCVYSYYADICTYAMAAGGLIKVPKYAMIALLLHPEAG